MDRDRKERIARNEARSRDLNERFGMGHFTCECGDADCHKVIGMSIEIYKSVRADDRRFLVAPGHEMPEIEDVVVKRKGFAVVRKRDEVAHVVGR